MKSYVKWPALLLFAGLTQSLAYASQSATGEDTHLGKNQNTKKKRNASDTNENTEEHSVGKNTREKVAKNSLDTGDQQKLIEAIEQLVLSYTKKEKIDLEAKEAEKLTQWLENKDLLAADGNEFLFQLVKKEKTDASKDNEDGDEEEVLDLALVPKLASNNEAKELLAYVNGKEDLKNEVIGAKETGDTANTQLVKSGVIKGIITDKFNALEKGRKKDNKPTESELMEPEQSVTFQSLLQEFGSLVTGLGSAAEKTMRAKALAKWCIEKCEENATAKKDDKRPHYATPSKLLTCFDKMGLVESYPDFFLQVSREISNDLQNQIEAGYKGHPFYIRWTGLNWGKSSDLKTLEAEKAAVDQFSDSSLFSFGKKLALPKGDRALTDYTKALGAVKEKAADLHLNFEGDDLKPQLMTLRLLLDPKLGFNSQDDQLSSDAAGMSTKKKVSLGLCILALAAALKVITDKFSPSDSSEDIYDDEEFDEEELEDLDKDLEDEEDTIS